MEKSEQERRNCRIIENFKAEKMKLKLWMCLALLAAVGISFAQTNAEKKLITGTYKCDYISYGDYYSYDVKKDKIEPGSKLSEMMAVNKSRLDAAFMESLRKKAAQYAQASSLIINSDNSFSINRGGKTENGNFEFLPTYMEPRKGSIESDITYNMAHKDDLVVIRLFEYDEISFRKIGNLIICGFSTGAKEIRYQDEFYASIKFSK